RLLTGPKGRGPQMNHAAGRTDADCLLFHHADSSLDRDALTELACALDDTECQWGGFRHRFSDSNRRLAFISWLHNYRWRKTGVIYGDQSMFVRRAFFDSLGGFPDHELEDLAFSDAALARAPSRCLDSYVVTDSRKFRQMGELRGLAHVLSIIVRYEHQRRIGNEAFFRPYR
ncbi:MAG: glycosyl transferase, partial [Pseudomonadota bacterium]